VSQLKAGFSQVDITPPLGVELCGYGPYAQRKAEEVLEKLYARTCVLRLGGTRLALVELDIIGIRREMTADIRRRVTAATGIPAKNVMLCCTHTHSGPATVPYIGWGEPDPKYLRRLPGLVAKGIEKAAADVRPAQVRYGESQITGMSFNRVSDRRHVDKRLVVLRIDVEGETAGFLAHTSIHPVALGPSSHYICGDFAGLAINAVAEEFPGAVGLFVQGACGDINVNENCLPMPEGLAALRKHADLFAGAVRRALKKARPLRVDRLAARLKAITLPQVPTDVSEAVLMFYAGQIMASRVQSPDIVHRRGLFFQDAYRAVMEKIRRGDRPGLKTEIQKFAVGGLLVLAQPSELYFTFYEKLRRGLRGRKVIFAGYTNDSVGYIPPASAFEVERLPAPGFSQYAPFFSPIMFGEYRYRKDVGDVLVARELALAESLMG